MTKSPNDVAASVRARLRSTVSAAFARLPARSDAMIDDAQPSDPRSNLSVEGARLICSNKLATRIPRCMVARIPENYPWCSPLHRRNHENAQK